MTEDQHGSGKGDFLARWSQRKRDARQQKSSAPAAIPGDAASSDLTGGRLGAEQAAAIAPGEAGVNEPGANEAGAGEAEITLEDLPPVESIDANTDLTPYLKRKVPEVWRQAALRRAWSADPAISQFVGLVENGWDWNAPDGVPGFGPLKATDDVAALLAQAIGARPAAAEEESVAAGGSAPEADVREIAAAAESADGDEPLSEPYSGQADRQDIPPETDAAAEMAAGEASSDDVPEPLTPGYHGPILKRRGGGALPV